MKKVFFGIFIVALVGVALVLTGVTVKRSQKETPTLLMRLNNRVDGNCDITSYTTYGRFFNLAGTIDGIYEDIVLILSDANDEIEYELVLEKGEDVTNFKTNKLINQGINLEKVPLGKYVFFIKIGEGEEAKYYTLNDRSKMKDITYYTITKESKNNEIKIGFEDYDEKSFMVLNNEDVKLPSDIYDVVVDPGHGGNDVGANKNGYYESKINLEYGLKLKESLEGLGLKVKLTRETDESIPNYGENSRVSIPYETKAKLLLSVHQNSAIYNVGDGGVEIYVPNHADNEFASMLATNIVENTSTIYSSNVANKIGRGVYLRKFSNSDLASMTKEAKDKGYTPYEGATTDTTYYYIIRETGGIVSGAYVDDRNSDKPWNIYYNSNHGCESYLLELGFINSTTNLNILLTEQDKYVKAITDSVKYYLEI